MTTHARPINCNLGGIPPRKMWTGTVRTPSPGPQRPTKRARQSYNSSSESSPPSDSAPAQTSAPAPTYDLGGQEWLEQGYIDDSWLDVGDAGLDAAWMEGFNGEEDLSAWLDNFTGSNTMTGTGTANPATPLYGLAGEALPTIIPQLNSIAKRDRKTLMQTGCIPCLVKGLRCDPRNPNCKRSAMSSDWNLNYKGLPSPDEEEAPDYSYPTDESASLTAFRPDITWRRSWRERHSLNFFVNFTAPQMAGFFDSTFWQRMVIQTSYHEPAILHAITAIGALHEAIMQRAFADERRKAAAMEFALSQCNKAIGSLTSASKGKRRGRGGGVVPENRLALTTCVLFTCFEAMQGRCDSAVNHALQGRLLLQASSSRTTTTSSDPNNPAEQYAGDQDDEVEQMRPLVERLEVQATALLDKGKRPSTDASDRISPLPPVAFIFSLEHAHNTLHTALNSIMRFMQGFHPTAPADHIAVTMAEKYLRYAPWFQQWEGAFTAFLASQSNPAAGGAGLGNMDFKRAMVLKANHLVGTMLASVDQSAGPVAYDPYESEFKAIVDLSREVLATFSCPPLPTLSGGATGAPYLSFSLWVTDPLWMAISRCRNPSIRQAAFTLLSQNPRQEGIWHAGPQLSNNRYMRRVESGNTGKTKETQKGAKPPEKPKEPEQTAFDSDSEDDDVDDEEEGEDSAEGEGATAAKGLAATGSAASGAAKGTMKESTAKPKARQEWVDLRAQIEQWTKHSAEAAERGQRRCFQQDGGRYDSVCTGRCSIPTLRELESDAEWH